MNQIPTAKEFLYDAILKDLKENSSMPGEYQINIDW